MIDPALKENTWIITQARIGSTRLPRKVMLEIVPGRTVLAQFVDQCLRVRNAAGVIVATTVEAEAAEIVSFCEARNDDRVRVWRGPVDDVLARYHQAAAHFGAKIIVRVTSDCPLFDPALVDAMLEEFTKRLASSEPLAYLCNNNPPTYPHGLDTEIFTWEALDCAFRETDDPFDREHVTPYIRKHPELFPQENYSQDADQSSMRWTLDYPEDLEFFRAVVAHLHRIGPEFTRRDVIDLLERRPDIAAINAGRHER